MMSFINDAILEALNSNNFGVTKLNDEQALALRGRLYAKFAPKFLTGCLWEFIENEASRHLPDGWRSLGRYPYQGEVVLFFDQHDESHMYVIDNLKNLVRVLEECPGFVFYVANQSGNFLLCHNDHDYLIGAGDARNWIQFVSSK